VSSLCLIIGGLKLNNFYKNKKVLVTGGTGLIGVKLIELLSYLDCDITVVSLDKFKPVNSPNINYINEDLRVYENCLKLTNDIDIVFHLAGVKGSPSMAINRPTKFFVPTILFNTNMIQASFQNKVKNFLYTSSIGVYSPAKVFYEDTVWKTFPSENDKYAGWAKRMGELQIEACLKESNHTNFHIVRPANVFGPFDNFDPKNAMVIPSLISRIVGGENPLTVIGDGSNVRDFIFSKDVAEVILSVVEKNIIEPINIGSGSGFSIVEIIKILKNIFPSLEVNWDKDKPSGDKIRVMSCEIMEKYELRPKTQLSDAILETVNWYKSNKSLSEKRYNSFNE